MKNPFVLAPSPQFAALLLAACNSSSPEILFEAAFPKPHQDPAVLPLPPYGLRPRSDTWRYRLSSYRRAAVITATAARPLFINKTYCFRGLPYFRRAKKVAACHRYTLQIQDNVIYGLKRHQVSYQLTDLKEKTVAGGPIRAALIHIDLRHPQSGIYALTLTLTHQQRREQESLGLILP
jgi:hypothetical protein